MNSTAAQPTKCREQGEMQTPRLRFQIHLSTAVALMFVAGALIWANTSWRRVENRFWSGNVTINSGAYDAVVHGYGWPFDALDKPAYVRINENDRAVDVELSERRWRGVPIAIDMGAAAAILFASWFVCEKFSQKPRTLTAL
jgi:hypothetical protein